MLKLVFDLVGAAKSEMFAERSVVELAGWDRAYFA